MEVWVFNNSATALDVISEFPQNVNHPLE